MIFLSIIDVQRSSYVSLVLCMLFSTGEPVPANLHGWYSIFVSSLLGVLFHDNRWFGFFLHNM